MTIAIQSEPTGMADAIIAAEPAIRPDVDTIVVLWGDQIGIQRETVLRSLAVHSCHDLRPAVTIPLARVDVPVSCITSSTPRAAWLTCVSGARAALRRRRACDCGCSSSRRDGVPVLRPLRLAGLLRGRLSHEENFPPGPPLLAREASVVGVTGDGPPAATPFGLNSTADLERLSRVTDGRRPTTD